MMFMMQSLLSLNGTLEHLKAIKLYMVAKQTSRRRLMTLYYKRIISLTGFL